MLLYTPTGIPAALAQVDALAETLDDAQLLALGAELESRARRLGRRLSRAWACAESGDLVSYPD